MLRLNKTKATSPSIATGLKPGGRCPACNRKLGERVQICPRCGIELATLYDLAASATRDVREGRRLLKANRPLDALQAFRSAQRIMASDEAKRGIAVSLLCNGRFKDALVEYVRILRENRES